MVEHGRPGIDGHHEREYSEQKIVDRHGKHKPRSFRIVYCDLRDSAEDRFRHQIKTEQNQHALGSQHELQQRVGWYAVVGKLEEDIGHFGRQWQPVGALRQVRGTPRFKHRDLVVALTVASFYDCNTTTAVTNV